MKDYLLLAAETAYRATGDNKFTWYILFLWAMQDELDPNLT